MCAGRSFVIVFEKLDRLCRDSWIMESKNRAGSLIEQARCRVPASAWRWSSEMLRYPPILDASTHQRQHRSRGAAGHTSESNRRPWRV